MNNTGPTNYFLSSEFIQKIQGFEANMKDIIKEKIDEQKDLQKNVTKSITHIGFAGPISRGKSFLLNKYDDLE